ncbi:MAG: hypothetical protein GXY51_10510 [Bacteroidetes bacterium]|nr:hypothetical protein [Bacteroidota bacterium]
MIKGLFIIFFFLLSAAGECFSRSDDLNDDRLRQIVCDYGQARVTIPFLGIRQTNELSRKLSISSVRNNTVEIVLSPLTLEWFIDQRLNYKIRTPYDPKDLITASDKGQAAEWNTYPSYSQYIEIMQGFAENYPAICLLDTIGTSNYGKLVLALKISDNVSVDEDEPETFYSSTIHGDETGGFVLMLRLADYLLMNYQSDVRVSEMINNLEIWINPLANPDGTYGTGDLISSPIRFNANGYDLNRNFPDPATPNTVTQTETTDMITFMREHNFVLSANFHSGTEVVNYPWDSRARLHADDEWFYSVSRKYADTVHRYSVPGYMTFLQDGVTNGYMWYSINGGRQDFVTRELQGREVTIELDYDYITPAEDLGSLWEYNHRSLLGYLENALSGIHGKVTDSKTGDPVKARIFVSGHDIDSSHVYSRSSTGTFVRLISPGAWDLLVTAEGYLPVNVDNVLVTENSITNLNIEMLPFVNPVDTIGTPVLILYPSPARESVRAVLPEDFSGQVRIALYDSGGRKIRDYYENATEDLPLMLDVRHLPDGVYVVLVSKTGSSLRCRKRFVVVR